MALHIPRPALILDSDKEFLDRLKFDPKATAVPPLLASNGKSAQLLLADLKKQMSGIFVNIAVAGSPNAFSVIRAAHQHRPALPVYLLHDGPLPFSPQELMVLPVQGIIAKPVTFSELMGRVSPQSLFEDVTSAPSTVAAANREVLESELTIEDAAFIPIGAEDFLSGSKSLFDVYVRLNSGRYVKILQAGDVFSPERLASYLKKGVTQFYLRKEVQERYLNYCDRLTGAILDSEASSLDSKISQTMNHGEETMSFLRSRGIGEASLSYASGYISNVQKLVTHLNPEKHDLLRSFMIDVVAYEHGVAVAMVASLMMRPMNIESDRAVHIVGMAALFHDIALPREFSHENEAKMTVDQRLTYRLHPDLGAEKLRNIPGIHPAVTQAVAQHHERRNKKGFPMRMGSGHVNRVAEIIGISDEFVRLIERSKADPEIDIIKELEMDIFAGFSRGVTDCFRSVFLTLSQSKGSKKP